MADTKSTPGKRRHWVLARNALARAKTRERDEDESISATLPPREAHTVDWGSLAALSAVLHEEMATRAQKNRTEEGEGEEAGEEIVREAIRDGLQQGAAVAPDGRGTAGYWSLVRTKDAENFVQDVVYGGVDGFAYVRSLAEFVSAGPQDYQAVCPYFSVYSTVCIWFTCLFFRHFPLSHTRMQTRAWACLLQIGLSNTS
jgi:bromodomain-containing protein 7